MNVHRIVATICLAGTASLAPGSGVFDLRFEPVDAGTAAAVRPMLEAGISGVESFFGSSYQRPFTVDLLPSREAFTAWFPPEWGMGETACWMVATGVDTRMAVLSPRVWKQQACEHDPDDETHVRNLLVHELVHVYQGQVHPSTDFEVPGIEQIGWFLEGLATYASGQLEEGHVAPAREAIEAGAAPERLADGWSGQYRYGVSGSLVQYVDVTFGRDVLVELMTASTEEEILGRIGLGEPELLAAWREFVLAR